MSPRAWWSSAPRRSTCCAATPTELERALQQAGLKTSDNGLQFSLRDQAFAGRDDERAAPTRHALIVPDDEPTPLEARRAATAALLRLGGGIDIRV